jgi:RHS repeat-associated protein
MNQSHFTAGCFRLRRLFFTALLLALMTTASRAQTSATDGATPAGLKPGAPAGSYSLSGFDNVNLYSGNLNFQMPLLGIGGRGGAGMTVTLKIDSEHWRVEKDSSGGTTSYDVTPNTWEGIHPGYGPGVLQGRRACAIMAQTNRCGSSLTRLTFTTSDGTEYELRDQLYSGQPRGAGTALGTVFVSADGAAATFISDATIYNPSAGPDLIYPSGYLMLADGTRYRIDYGVVTWLRDHNGNKLSFTYDVYYRVTTITDSLNRQVTVTYANLTTIFYDEISYKGFGSAQHSIKVWHTNLGQALRAGYAVETYGQLFGGSNGATYNPNDVVSAMDLPDGRRYQFFYNSYGELARVVLPTGGAIEYDYTPDSGYLTDGNDYQIYRRVTERRVYPDGTNLEGKQVYTFTYSAPASAKPWYSTATVEHRSATAVLACDKHYFYGSPVAALFQYTTPTIYPAWKEGREYQTEALDTAETTVLRRTANTWRQRASLSWWTGAADEEPSNDPRMVETINTIEPTGANLVSKTTSIDPADQTGQTVGFDQYNNQTDVWEYGYGSTPGTIGALVRRTHTDYLTTNPVNGSNYATDTSVHIRRLPAQSSVYDAAGAEQARTTYEYDNYVSDTGHAPLVARAGISGLDAAFTTGYQTRGNTTRVSHWILSNGTALSSYPQYDVAGGVVKTIDPRGYVTVFDFTDRFGSPDGEARSNTAPSELSAQGQTSYAFVTKVTNALGHTSYGQYDYYTGKPVDGEDTNGIVTSGYYNDPLDRAKQVVRAVGTSAQSQTTFDYDLAAHAVTTTGDLNNYNDNQLKSQTLYDGLGRTIETRQYESSINYITVKQSFDPLGRVSQSSNPYRPWQGESPVWTTTDYDALGRAWRLTTPDGAKLITHFDGARTLVTDQMNRQRLSQTDALGRLTDVWEVRSSDGATEAVTFPSFADVPGVSAGYRTSYTYDVLGNLRKVEQGTQQRFFMYDSLGRLLRAKNPEQSANGSLALTDTVTGNAQWSLGYTYDPNGNILTKTDARNTSVTYVYDALNRNTSVDYSDTTINPDVTRFYDGATLGKGRFWYSYAGGNWTNGSTVEHEATDSYDAMGRPLIGRQLFKTNGVWGSPYQSQRGYNLAGSITSETYPSGRTVSYQYDAAGRLNDFSGNLGDGTQRTYSTGIQYTSANALKQEQFGTDTAVYNKLTYNVRQQLSEIRVGTTANDTGWNRGALINHYSDQTWAGSGTDNNGTLKKQDVYIPNDDAITGYSLTTQFYSYDALNRLQNVREVRDGANQWQQDYTLDRYGNRTINQSSWGGAPKPQYGVDATTNRLTAPTGYSMTYDNAGYLTYDNYQGGAGGGGTRVYDAEGRMTSAQFVSGQQQTAFYSYNAEGQRVRRQMGAGGEVWQVYGVGGELVAEYAAGAAYTSPQKEYGYRGKELLVTAGVDQSNAPQTTYTASTQFSSTQGQGQWYYQYWNGSSYIDMTWDATNNVWTAPQLYLWVWSNGQHPGSIGDSVRKWVAPRAGTVHVTGQVRKGDTTGGSGVNAKVLLNASTLFNQDIAYNDGVGYAVDLTVTVAAGDAVYFRVNANGNTNNDSTAWDPTIEYQSTAPASLQWLISDQLGTPRMVIDKTGTLSNVKRHDYLPYGEELSAGMGGRTTGQGYVSDSVRQKFTGYERDGETRLDFAEARYCSSSQGRFTSPDPLGASMSAADPQSFNRYAYTHNDPVNRTDPTGLKDTFLGTDGGGGGFLPGADGAMGRAWAGVGSDMGNDAFPDQHMTTPYGEGDYWADEEAEGSVGGAIGDAAEPQQTTPQPQNTTQQKPSCDATLTGDANVDEMTRYVFAEAGGNPAQEKFKTNYTGSWGEITGIIQVFINRYNANQARFRGQQFTGPGGVLSRASIADDHGGSNQYNRAAPDKLSSLSPDECEKYKLAHVEAKGMWEYNQNHPGVNSFHSYIHSSDYLWFLGGNPSTPGLRIGSTTFYNFDPNPRNR